MRRALGVFSVLVLLASTPEGRGGWSTPAGGPEDQHALAAETQRVLGDLEMNPSDSTRGRFLVLFQRIHDTDHIAAGPGSTFTFGRAYLTAAALARAGDARFLTALMRASLGPYGRSAGGGEFINELLWECLENDPALTMEVLAALPVETRRAVMAHVYTAPIHDGFDFRAIHRALHEIEVPEEMTDDLRRVRAICRDAVRAAIELPVE